MLQDDKITKEEKQSILDFLGASESLSEEILEAASSLSENKEEVFEELNKINQVGAYKPHYPEPMMPSSEASPSAEFGSDEAQDPRSLTEEEVLEKLKQIVPVG